MTTGKLTIDWIAELLQKSKMREHGPQICLMAKIWDFLVKNEKFDYTAGDLRRETDSMHVNYSSIINALWKLQILGLINEKRTVLGKPTFQTTTWKV